LTVETTSQQMAEEAYRRIAGRKLEKEYTSFAREFPTLVHSCGLAQALAFAQAKSERHRNYADDLAKVLAAAGHSQVGTPKELAHRIRNCHVTQYIRISRDSLAAAVWLKRYVEAAGEDEPAREGT
jgi:CRISPR-associated protein Cmr5